MITMENSTFTSTPGQENIASDLIPLYLRAVTDRAPANTTVILNNITAYNMTIFEGLFNIELGYDSDFFISNLNVYNVQINTGIIFQFDGIRNTTLKNIYMQNVKLQSVLFMRATVTHLTLNNYTLVDFNGGSLAVSNSHVINYKESVELKS